VYFRDTYFNTESRDSSVGIETRLWVEPRNRGSIPGSGKRDRLWSPLTLLVNGAGEWFPGNKAAGASHSHPETRLRMTEL
jgi:hypothetical protein